MEWRDQGVILNSRKYGEYDAIIDVLTRERGRHTGIVKGGFGRRHRGSIQLGNEVTVTWRGRLETHLGTYSVELAKARAATFLYNPAKLAALNSCCSLLSITIAENEAHETLLDGLLAFLDALEVADNELAEWAPLLIRWEIGLLTELGFGLNLDSCAASGRTDELIYVSPKSGRAVSREAGAPYHDKMLMLPPFLKGNSENITITDLNHGLALTEFFMERHMLGPHSKKIPQARRMLRDYIV
ncbi:MAG: DNA repair protein RecO [Alphaproteobacteria bacterium]|nr:DNA repair protein RecO [Alphaproteobacteria bacterium]HPF45741.1 DNA repair protein RecO [Emcibacteraceae bacterium]HRW29369.1 DNA repair protein RecO [Emcibacteraceae bacterium]